MRAYGHAVRMNRGGDSVIRHIKPLPAATRRMNLMDGKENIDWVVKKKGGTIEVAGSFVKFTPGGAPSFLLLGIDLLR